MAIYQLLTAPWKYHIDQNVIMVHMCVLIKCQLHIVWPPLCTYVWYKLKCTEVLSIYVSCVIIIKYKSRTSEYLSLWDPLIKAALISALEDYVVTTLHEWVLNDFSKPRQSETHEATSLFLLLLCCTSIIFESQWVFSRFKHWIKHWCKKAHLNKIQSQVVWDPCTKCKQ